MIFRKSALINFRVLFIGILLTRKLKGCKFVDEETKRRRFMSKEATQHQIPKETMNAAWAIAIGAIAPMLDSTMINIGIQQLNQTFHTNIDIVQWGLLDIF